jgi:hypothetical protein
MDPSISAHEAHSERTPKFDRKPEAWISFPSCIIIESFGVVEGCSDSKPTFTPPEDIAFVVWAICPALIGGPSVMWQAFVRATELDMCCPSPECLTVRSAPNPRRPRQSNESGTVHPCPNAALALWVLRRYEKKWISCVYLQMGTSQRCDNELLQGMERENR